MWPKVHERIKGIYSFGISVWIKTKWKKSHINPYICDIMGIVWILVDLFNTK